MPEVSKGVPSDDRVHLTLELVRAERILLFPYARRGFLTVSLIYREYIDSLDNGGTETSPIAADSESSVQVENCCDSIPLNGHMQRVDVRGMARLPCPLALHDRKRSGTE